MCTGGGVTLTGLQSIRDELLNIQIQQQTSLQTAPILNHQACSRFKPSSPPAAMI
jgi:hypothetical protein